MPNYTDIDSELEQRIAAVDSAGEVDRVQTFNETLKSDKPVTTWLHNLPKNITVGTIDAVLNTADFAKDVTAGEDAEPRQDLNPVFSGEYARNTLTTFRNWLSEDSNLGDEITQSLAQFVVPFAGWSKAIGGLRTGKALLTTAKALTAESAAVATGYEADEGRFADLLAYSRELDNRFGQFARRAMPDGSLANSYIEYMTAREGDTEAEGRFKNVLDNLVATGVIAAPVGAAVAGVRIGRRVLEEGPRVPGSPGLQKGMVSFHGSPHNFDAFDSSKIGTGEGAQAYGHGLYFAENQKIANQYRRNLTQDRNVELDGFDHDKGYGAKDEAGSMRWFDNEKDAKDFKREAMGALYHVDIPDESVANMLDWDKPMSQQPEAVQQALAATGPLELRDGMDLAGGGKLQIRSSVDGARSYYLDMGGRQFSLSPADVKNLVGTGVEGKSAYQALSTKLGGDEAASKWLREHGVPGIKYLDAGSRPANISNAALYALWEKHGRDAEKAVDDFMRGVHETPAAKAKMRETFLEELRSYKGTRNIVLFDDKLAKIIKKE